MLSFSPSPVFSGFLGDRRRDSDGEKGCTSLDKMPTYMSLKMRLQGKVHKAAFIWVTRGQDERGGSVGASVIVSLLIKVKGVSRIVSHTLLLDICCFQVEEMFLKRVVGGCSAA